MVHGLTVQESLELRSIDQRFDGFFLQSCAIQSIFDGATLDDLDSLIDHFVTAVFDHFSTNLRELMLFAAFHKAH